MVKQIKSQRRTQRVQTIFAGDLNSRPESTVYALIKKNQITKQVL